MNPRHFARLAGLTALAVTLLFVHGASSQRPATPAPFVPRFEAVAETKLLMEGLASSNHRGLQRLLKEKPADAETWTFARGQALLLAETGNLLLLRPPRNSGRDTWMKLAMSMRDVACDLAQKTGSQDYEGSKRAMTNLATSCNRCHEIFRIPTRVQAWGPPTEVRRLPAPVPVPDPRAGAVKNGR